MSREMGKQMFRGCVGWQVNEMTHGQRGQNVFLNKKKDILVF